MKRSYLSAGAQYTASQDQKNNLDTAIKNLQWCKMTDVKSVPGWKHYALKAMMATMGVNVDRIGHCDTLFGRYTLLAIRSNYDKGEIGRVTLYAIELGDRIISLALDEEPVYEVQLKNELAGITDTASLFTTRSVSYQPLTPIS